MDLGDRQSGESMQHGDSFGEPRRKSVSKLGSSSVDMGTKITKVFNDDNRSIKGRPQAQANPIPGSRGVGKIEAFTFRDFGSHVDEVGVC